jgi:hypothetical protein
LLQTLRLLKKWWYILQWWLYFKKARGIVPPPVYKYENVNELISAVEKSINEATVVLASIKTTQNWAGFRRIGCRQCGQGTMRVLLKSWTMRTLCLIWQKKLTEITQPCVHTCDGLFICQLYLLPELLEEMDNSEDTPLTLPFALFVSPSQLIIVIWIKTSVGTTTVFHTGISRAVAAA